MLRPALIVSLLAAAAAHAGWRNATVAGTARDVTMPDAGVAVVATTSGALTMIAAPDGGFSSAQTMAGTYVTAAQRGPCTMGFTGPALSVMVFDGPCNTNYSFHNLGGKVRVTSAGVAYAVTANGVGTQFLERLGPTPAVTLATTWTQLPTSGAAASPFYPLSALATDGGDWVVSELYPLGQPTLSLFNGGTLTASAQVGLVRDVALFDHDDRPGAVVVNDGGQFFLTQDLAAAAPTLVPVPVLPWSSVSFVEKGGSAFGRGFGMATASGQVYSAVPNPNQIGRQWVPRTAGGVPTSLTRITCIDPASCMGVSSAATPNVFAYSNDNAPAAQAATANVTAGTNATFTLDAGDLDGDPIWITWVDGGFVWDGGNPASVTVVGPPATCAAPPGVPPLVAVLSDGYAPHDRTVVIPVVVAAGMAGAPPLTASPPTLMQTAGSGVTTTLTASYAGDSGCALPALTWSVVPSDGGIVLSAAAGNTVAVTPPEHFCSPTPRVFDVVASGAPDASVGVQVTLNPWGRPNPPAFAGGLSQPSGTTQSYAPAAVSSHVCALTNGFPGTELVWFGLDAGGLAGVTLTGGGAALTVASTDSCVAGSVTGFARRQVSGVAPAQESFDAGRIDVALLPDWQPITAATPFDAGFAYDSAQSRLTGDFSVGTNCLVDRDLRAVVVVNRDPGPVVGTRLDLPVPGPWFVDIPGGCSGGDFVARASLIDDAGMTYGPQPVYAFSAPRLPAHVPALTVTEVPVSCAQGARGTLALALDPADCAAQRFTWAGAAVTAVSDGGHQATFATPTGDLQGQAGRLLSFDITATIGPGNVDTATRSVRLVPERFIEVTHRSDVPVAREEESVGVEVTLSNPTACAVSGVTLREALGGLKPIDGSVRVDGVAVAAAIREKVLEVPDLAIAANGTTTVRYLARVPLLSAARPLGTATFAGTDVTVLRGLPAPATGCGCSSFPAGGSLALIALALVRARRRRSG